MVKAYLKYWINTLKTDFLKVESVREFYQEVIRKASREKYERVETLRKDLLSSKNEIQVEDFGAGSRKTSGTTRKVREIAKNAGVRRPYGELLARIIRYYELKKGLELGTSFGLGSAYLAKNAEHLITVEGCPQTAEVARKNFEKLAIQNITQRIAPFSKALQDFAEEGNTYDFIYIDGNHRKEPTLAYFDFALKHAHEDTFIIFDDINWSKEMQEAWYEIRTSDKVNLTIDLFQLGIVCPGKINQKENFVLKF